MADAYATTDQCTNCMFWRSTNNGTCHYNAPAVGVNAGWSQVSGTDWCGDGISVDSDHHQFSRKYNRQGMLGPAN